MLVVIVLFDSAVIRSFLYIRIQQEVLASKIMIVHSSFTVFGLILTRIKNSCVNRKFRFKNPNSASFTIFPVNTEPRVSANWASEASPTLGCSIEISRDIYIYMCMCLSWSKKRRRNYVGQTRACSKSVLGGKIRPETPILFISTML